MAAFAGELRAACEEHVPLDVERTFVAAPTPGTTYVRRTGHRGLVLAALALLALGAIAAGVLSLGGSGAHKAGSRTSGVAGAAAVALHAIGNFDPDGNPDSHADTARLATDGDPTTYWQTQIYATPQFGGLKHGLGLELQAASPVELKQLTVSTTTPGFTAQVLAGRTPDSPSMQVGAHTTFALRGVKSKTYVLWITALPPGGTAHVTEISGS